MMVSMQTLLIQHQAQLAAAKLQLNISKTVLSDTLEKLAATQARLAVLQTQSANFSAAVPVNRDSLAGQYAAVNTSTTVAIENLQFLSSFKGDLAVFTSVSNGVTSLNQDTTQLYSQQVPALAAQTVVDAMVAQHETSDDRQAAVFQQAEDDLATAEDSWRETLESKVRRNLGS